MSNPLDAINYPQSAELKAAEIMVDLDGTLVKGDLGESVFFHMLLQKTGDPYDWFFSREARKIISAFGGRDQLLETHFTLIKNRQFLEATKYLTKFIAKIPVEEITRLTWSILQRNCPPELIEDPLGDGRGSLKLRYGASLQQELITLVKSFLEQEARIWIVSASPQPIVEVFGAMMGIPRKQVLAVKMDSRGEQFIRVPYGQGKVDALASVGIGTPYIAFGNSLGDLAVLEKAQFPVVMESSYQDLLDIAHDRGWLLFKPGLGLELT